jgi:hypothetical protein
VNERRNPTLSADNLFFSSSFHGFFPSGSHRSAAALGQIGVKSRLHSLTGRVVRKDGNYPETGCRQVGRIGKREVR